MLKKLFVLVMAMGLCLGVNGAVNAKPAKMAAMKPMTKAVTMVAKVNVNTADVKTLAKVKGLSKSKAKAIVKYREKNGSFKSVDELAKVRGISAKKAKKLATYLEV